MKQTLQLIARPQGIYINYCLAASNEPFMCEEFVQWFLSINYPPAKISLTYTDKNPKEKGFKKIVIAEKPNELSYSLYVSGKKYKDVDFFWQLERLLCGRGPWVFWVKIKEV